jgi:hypothetical protein
MSTLRRFDDDQYHGPPRMGLKTSYNGFGPKIRDESYEWMKEEIRSGRVPPPNRCMACGETRGHLDYHTEDYSRPFGPHIYKYPLCFRCHMMLHIRFRSPDRWHRYIAQLERGAVYEPLMHRGEIGKIWLSGWMERPISWVAPRGELTFFRSLSCERPRPTQGQLFE